MWKLMIKRMMDKNYRELSENRNKRQLSKSIEFAKDLFRGAKFKIVRE